MTDLLESEIQKSSRNGRAASRQPGRQAQRTNERGMAPVIGRNGEILSRKRRSGIDIFDIPKELIPEGWEYQWCAVSVVGNKEILLDQNLLMAENGWRPVPSDRYPGRFMPEGHKGNIIRGDQMLMERPSILCQEARAEDERNARQLVSDRNESLKIQKAKGDMPDGFEMSRKYRGTGGDVRMTIDPGLDIPPPQHQLAEPGD